MRSTATTVEQYLARLPADRREALAAVRRVVLANLDRGYEEGIQYGMIGYYVPHRVFPAGYHCDPRQPLPFAGMASQKDHLSLFLGCVYGNPVHEKWFRGAWARTGKKLDMGKACIRFKRLDDLPLEVIGEAIRRIPVTEYIRSYQKAFGEAAARKLSARPARKAAARPRAVTKGKAATRNGARTGARRKMATSARAKGK
ncbi:MAG: DUF1801 domain-containing protein [Phycisphaerales bacterium]